MVSITDALGQGNITQIGSAALSSGSLNSFIPPIGFPTSGNVVSSTGTNNLAATSSPTSDFRVRISPLNTSFYGTSSPTNVANGNVNTGVSGTMSTGQLTTNISGASNLLAPLIATQGVMFPYTPQISVQHDVEYSSTEMIQTNLTYEVYRKTPSVTLTVAGKFTVQNQKQGEYAIAAIHFFRVASKMYFGTLAGNNAGLPPPILVLSGYGTYMFGASPQTGLKCILKNYSYNYAENMDTVSINVAGGSVRLPAMFDLSVTIEVQQTPQQMRTSFDLNAFRTGALMKLGGWI